MSGTAESETTSTQSEDASRLAVLVAAGALLVVLGGILARPQRLNHDCALYLQTGELLLRGQRTYVDFRDVNPPMIMYLNVIPALVCRFSPLPPATTFNLLVWILAVWSAWQTRRLLRLAGADWERAGSAVVAGLALAQLWVLAVNEWGQREHLFACVALPYFALRMARLQSVTFSRTGPVILGLVTGVVACIKPHFVVVLAGVEAYLVMQSRRPRTLLQPETLSLAAAGAAYAAHFAFLNAESREAFFGRIIPLLTAHYSSVYGIGIAATLRRPQTLAGLVAAALAFLVPVRGRAQRQLVRMLGVAGFVAAVMMIQQQKGWTYHSIPGVSSLFCILALLADQMPRPRLDRLESVLPGPVIAAAVGCVVLLGRVAVSRSAWRAGEDAFAPTVRDLTRPGDAVMVLDTSVGAAYPALIQADRLPGSRYLWLFPIPLLFDPRDKSGETADHPYLAVSASPAEEAHVLEELTEDISTRRPSLITMQTTGSCYMCPKGFSIEGYLKARGFVDRSLKDYERRGEAGTQALYLARWASQRAVAQTGN